MKRKILFSFIIFLIAITQALVCRAEPIANFMNKILPFENLEVAGYFKNETFGIIYILKRR